MCVYPKKPRRGQSWKMTSKWQTGNTSCNKAQKFWIETCKSELDIQVLMVCFFAIDEAIVKKRAINLFDVLILINQKFPWGDIEVIFCQCNSPLPGMIMLSATPGESISREYKFSCFGWWLACCFKLFVDYCSKDCKP